ncbi:MAG: hypothetical protein AAGG09_00365 [Pseudomonadota bacterium]
MDDRLLICVPRGGLNDTLCQIGKCWTYAERWNRKLFIDPALGGLFGFLWDVFEEQPYTAAFRDSVIVRDRAAAMALADGRPIRPACLAPYYGKSARNARYAEFDSEQFRFVHIGTREPTSFDLHRNYPEDVLVHHDCGGGTESVGVLHRIRLKPEIRDEVLARMTHLPKQYVSVHVRSTDLTSDYKRFFELFKDQLADRNVLVCSDNQAVIDHAQAVLTSSAVYTNETRRSTTGEEIHHAHKWDTSDEARRRAALIELLTDLLALGRGTDILVAPTFGPLMGSRRQRLKMKIERALRLEVPASNSGFSELARYLCANKDVLDLFAGVRSGPGQLADTEAADMRAV